MRPLTTVGRRLGILPGWRSRLAAILTLAAAGAFAGGARADSQSPLVVATVYHPGGSPTTATVSLSDLQARSGECPQYQQASMRELGRQGWIEVPLPPSTASTGTWTLGGLLQCMTPAIPSGAVTGVTIDESDGSAEEGAGSQITTADLASPSDFQNAAENPVISDEGTEVEYDRPWRGGSDEDYEDEVNEAPPLSIDVYEGPALDVTATASRTTVSPGTTVSFTAAVTGADDAGLAYDWNFDGGAANSSQVSPEITFQTPGVWDVTVLVTDAAGGGGGAEVPITVTGGAPASGSGSPTGPTKSSGKTRGAAAGRAQPRSSTTGASPKSDSTTGPAKGSGTRDTATGNRASAATSAPSTGGASSGSSAPGQTTRRPARAHVQSRHGAGRAHPASRAAPARTSPARPVEGQLIAGLIPVAPAASPLVRSQAAVIASAPARRSPPASSILKIVGAAAAIVVLLALGAARELEAARWWRGRRARRRPTDGSTSTA
ncbi:MAG TPA: PKD domain-containing protein [Acidimicrobiales bacterium]|nr:PKD domain-containing protein [Acidimicrobiales bacterium]